MFRIDKVAQAKEITRFELMFVAFKEAKVSNPSSRSAQALSDWRQGDKLDPIVRSYVDRFLY